MLVTVLVGEVAWQVGIQTLDLFETVDTSVPKVVARDIYIFVTVLVTLFFDEFPLRGGGHDGGRHDAARCRSPTSL